MRLLQHAAIPVFSLVLFSSWVLPVARAASKDDFYNLYDYLLSNHTYYKKEIRPADMLSVPLVVYMNFYLLSIMEVDEKQQMLQTSARLEMFWDDDFLEWAPADHGNITELLVPQEHVYVPDIVLANSVTAQKQIGYKELPVRLYSDGTLQWVPTLVLSTECDIDITYFPFETQKCQIDFQTAISTNREIDIDVLTGTSAIDLYDFSTNGQWELVETSAENLSDEDSKTKIRFSLVIKRRRTFYVINIVLPVFFLSLTSSLVFAIPAAEGEKMGTGITVLLAFAVYLSIVSDIIPNTSLQVSILGLYLTILVGLSAISVVICSFNLRLHARDDDIPVGPCTTRLIKFLRFMCCESNKKSKKNEQPAAREMSVFASRTSMDREQHMSMSTTRRQDSRFQSLPPVSLNRIQSPPPGHLPTMQFPSSSDVQFYRGSESLAQFSSSRGMQPPPPGHSSRVRSASNRGNPRQPHSAQYSPTPIDPRDDRDPMTWKTVAETLDWTYFIFFTFCTFAVTLVCLLYLHFGSIEDAPSL